LETVLVLGIAGSTGLTGRFVIDALREQGHVGMVRCLTRPASMHGDVDAGLKIERYPGDCRDVASLVGFLAGVDNLVHLAGIRFAENVISACLSGGVSRVTFINTTGMYSRYRKYAAEYIRIEEAIKTSGLRYTIVRPTMIYGNHLDHNIHKLVKVINRLPVIPIVGDGSSLMQPIYAKDLADFVVRVALDPSTVHKEYNVAGESPIKYRDLLNEICMALGKRRLFVHIPNWLAMAVGYLGEVVPNGLVNVEKIQRLREDKHIDYSLARDELGFGPRSFHEGVLLEVDSLRRTGVISRGHGEALHNRRLER
jgi:nucleoside-diphosphate-sugar epimerase